jgi:hypothetical protein
LLCQDPELEARIQTIKAQLEEADYQRMVANVDMGSHLHQTRSGKAKLVPECKLKSAKINTCHCFDHPVFFLLLLLNTVKTAQGQMIAIFNVVLVVAGAFVFGYKAVEYSLEKPDFVKVCLLAFDDQRFQCFMCALFSL